MRGFQPGNHIRTKRGQWAVALRQENIDLKAALEEANAHLAWAREDGGKHKDELNVYIHAMNILNQWKTPMALINAALEQAKKENQ